jgi:hypothetical protein
MIVKNEEENIEKCLSNVTKYVDEIIVVDTGSIDNTASILKKFTDKVYNYNWCDDFAAARNFSISKANSDWILVLDADEVVLEADLQSLNKFIKNNEKTVGRIKRINVLEDHSGTRKYIERVNRVFNRKYFYYEGIIHEQVTSKFGDYYRTEPIDLVVDHIGYTKEVLNRTNKINRNITLLNQAIEKKPKDPYLIYQLGKSYFLNKEYLKASESFSKALSFNINFQLEYAIDLVEAYGYSLINSNQFKEALKIKDYSIYYKSLPEYNFLMGLIYMNNGQFSLAINSFISCTNANNARIEGITTYLPYYNIGVIFECLGYKNEAIKYYVNCKQYKPAIDRLNNL